MLKSNMRHSRRRQRPRTIRADDALEIGGAEIAAAAEFEKRRAEQHRRDARLEQFQQKGEPVLRPELRLNKEMEHFR